MAPDYDAPRTRDDEQGTESLDALKDNRSAGRAALLDVEEADTAEGHELPGADLSGEELQITVIPVQADEFTCASCFLVRHRAQKAREKNGLSYCTDCEG
jgi:hypothetical protein